MGSKVDRKPLASEDALKQLKKSRSTKEKADALRRPATGGGPKPLSPSPVEAEFLSGMGNRPTLSGLASGYDTEEVQIELVHEFNSDSNIVPSSNDTDTACTNAVNYQLIDLPVVTTSTGQRTSKRRKTMEDEEILTLQAEREKLGVNVIRHFFRHNEVCVGCHEIGESYSRGRQSLCEFCLRNVVVRILS
uniref:Uncharacterized protein n=1 Tax=Magallana gigas TaxID=29159 RepID=A0A8W8IGJ8_MAGGI